MKNNKLNDQLQLCSIVGYEHIKIYQPHDNYFRMTSDSLALANFVQIHYRDKNVLDIGTGLGCIPLVLCTRFKTHVTAVEIDKNVAKIAMQSVFYNHLEKQISIINDDIKNYAKQSHPNIYDIIISNPPYYSINNGYLNSYEIVAKAKHDMTLQLEDIFSISNKLLKDHGKLVLVFTTSRLMEIIKLYQKYNFAIKRLQFIHGRFDKSSKSFLIEGSKNGKESTVVCAPFIMNIEGESEYESKKL